MKIALSIADMSVGGVATFVLNLSQSLVQAGYEVMVVAQRQGAWWPRLAEIGVHGYALPRRRWDSVWQAARRFAAYVTAQHVDVLLVNIGIDNRLPMLALHLLPDTLPVALVLHNDRPEVYDLAAVNQAAWNYAVGVSPKVQQVAQARFPQKAIHWISHGIALPTPEQLSERMGWSTPLRLLFVGRLEDHQKGIFRLPLILRGCRDQDLPVHLTVIGDGPDRNGLAQLCQTSGVAHLVDLVGFQPGDTVLAQMRTHHLLLLPSNFEGLGLVIQEAQASGCLPIAAHLGGVTDVMITHEVNGMLVAPTNIAGFVDAIHASMIPERWHEYSQAAVNHAQQHYVIQTMGERYVTLFKALQQGLYPLPMARAALRKVYRTPFTWQDYLPRPLRVCLPNKERRQGMGKAGRN